MYFDSLVHDPKSLQFLVDFAGVDRVVLGSDYPFPLGEDIPGTLIKNSGFSDEIKSDLLGGNAMRWLNLEGKFRQ
jgi:aminocarboxymuconate-semialdehyde decarboxylase